MWHSTNISIANPEECEFVKCWEECCSPPTHRCTFCEMEREIEDLRAKLIAMEARARKAETREACEMQAWWNGGIHG